MALMRQVQAGDDAIATGPSGGTTRRGRPHDGSATTRRRGDDDARRRDGEREKFLKCRHQADRNGALAARREDLQDALLRAESGDGADRWAAHHPDEHD